MAANGRRLNRRKQVGAGSACRKQVGAGSACRKQVIEKCGFTYVKTVPYETRFGTIESSREYILYSPEKQN